MGKEEETSDELTKAGLKALETQVRHQPAGGSGKASWEKGQWGNLRGLERFGQAGEGVERVHFWGAMSVKYGL